MKENEDCSDYYFDILRYLYIYNLIVDDKYITI